jgi:hypothetical protein
MDLQSPTELPHSPLVPEDPATEVLECLGREIEGWTRITWVRWLEGLDEVGVHCDVTGLRWCSVSWSCHQPPT